MKAEGCPFLVARKKEDTEGEQYLPNSCRMDKAWSESGRMSILSCAKEEDTELNQYLPKSRRMDKSRSESGRMSILSCAKEEDTELIIERDGIYVRSTGYREHY